MHSPFFIWYSQFTPDLRGCWKVSNAVLIMPIHKAYDFELPQSGEEQEVLITGVSKCKCILDRLAAQGHLFGREMTSAAPSIASTASHTIEMAPLALNSDIVPGSLHLLADKRGLIANLWAQPGQSLQPEFPDVLKRKALSTVYFSHLVHHFY